MKKSSTSNLKVFNPLQPLNHFYKIQCKCNILSSILPQDSMLIQYQMLCEHLSHKVTLSTAGHQENVVTLELKDRSVLRVKMTVWVGDLDSCFEASHTLEGLKTGQVSERWYSIEIKMQYYCGKSGTKQNILNQLCCEDIFGIQMDLFCRSIFCVVYTPYWFVFFLGIQLGVMFFLVLLFGFCLFVHFGLMFDKADIKVQVIVWRCPLRVWSAPLWGQTFKLDWRSDYALIYYVRCWTISNR